ncbi:J domain-containing protein [Dyella flava]|uniref:J domain-containing protein n=1 Tax=Dyella flava TaxID=1920170 RepID=A0ABS2K5N9_9GAMM|nr:J domain-containing protein [Dyella flava]MBM7126380.1 hypothetical protein [Dyella flava]GLQ49801.1 hypothetical protein GCM10010872_12500 [Dyella flava]
MNWAFELLGLPLDADAASIKRAYARLLRTTRPDDDPEAFQRLHAAYKSALAKAGKSPVPAAQPSEQTLSSTGSPSPAAAGDTPAGAAQRTHEPITQPAPPAAPIVNIGALAHEVIRTAIHADSSRDLSSWLQSRQDFWSILVKQQTGQIVIQRLFQQPQSMSADCLDTLLRFFDLDHVLSGINPFALQRLRRQQSLQWELMPEHHYELAQRIQLRRHGRPDMETLKLYLQLLQQPLDWLKAVKIALHRGAVDRIGHFLYALCQGHINDLPASFNQRSVLFWYKATPRAGAMSWPRFAINSLRVTAIGLACALLTTAVFLADFATGGMPGRDALRFSTTFSLTIMGSLISLWLLFAGWIYVDHWQGLPESAPSRLPWLRRLIIPVLCAIGFTLYQTGAPTFLAGPLVFASLVLAVRRFRRRSIQRTSKRAWRIGATAPGIAFLCIVIFNAFTQVQIDSDLPFMTAAVCITFGTWFADMWRHRAHLHPKLARR